MGTLAMSLEYSHKKYATEREKKKPCTRVFCFPLSLSSGNHLAVLFLHSSHIGQEEE